MNSYIFEHAECLREHDDLPLGPGGISVIVQRRVYLRRCDRPLAALVAGATLFSEVSDDLPSLVARHLWGPTPTSLLRQAIAWHLADDHALSFSKGVPAYDEAAIDRWLDDNTAFVVGQLPLALLPQNDPGALGPYAEFKKE